MAEQKNVRISVKLPSETLTFPRKPFDVATGAYFIWPFNLDMHGVRLKYATAQLLCKIERTNETYYFFSPQTGIAPEFAFDAKTVRDAKSAAAKIEKLDGNIFVSGLTPGTKVAASITAADGHTINLVLLSPEQALNAWKARLAGRERLLLSAADLFFDQDTINLRSRDPQNFSRFHFSAARYGRTSHPGI